MAIVRDSPTGMRLHPPVDVLPDGYSYTMSELQSVEANQTFQIALLTTDIFQPKENERPNTEHIPDANMLIHAIEAENNNSILTGCQALATFMLKTRMGPHTLL